MCFGSKPAPQQPTPAMPTRDDAATDDDLYNRRRTRSRQMGAVNSATSNLSGLSGNPHDTILGSRGPTPTPTKTLLGQ